MANTSILMIIDNGSYGSTGAQPTYARKKTKLEAVAAACSCEKHVTCQEMATEKALEAAIDSKKMTVIVMKCDGGNIEQTVIDVMKAVSR